MRSSPLFSTIPVCAVTLCVAIAVHFALQQSHAGDLSAPKPEAHFVISPNHSSLVLEPGESWRPQLELTLSKNDQSQFNDLTWQVFRAVDNRLISGGSIQSSSRAEASANDSVSRSWQPSIPAPDDPGIYEVRFVVRESNRVRQSLTATICVFGSQKTRQDLLPANKTDTAQNREHSLPSTESVNKHRLTGLKLNESFFDGQSHANGEPVPTPENARRTALTFHRQLDELTRLIRRRGDNAVLLELPLRPNETRSLRRSVAPRIDFLTLLLRSMQAENVRVVVVLRLPSELSVALGPQGSDSNSSLDLDLVDSNGVAARELRELRGLNVPTANVLHSAVQSTIADEMANFVSKYRSFPTLDAVGLKLDESSPAQLPGIQWGFDDTTLDRFAQASHVTLPEGTTTDRAAFTLNQHRATWIRWRCEELARFHRRMAASITENSRLRYVLSLENAISDQSADADGILQGTRTLASAFQERGIDVELLKDRPELVVVRSVHPDPTGDGNLSIRRDSLDFHRGWTDLLANVRSGIVVQKTPPPDVDQLHLGDTPMPPPPAVETHAIIPDDWQLMSLFAKHDIAMSFQEFSSWSDVSTQVPNLYRLLREIPDVPLRKIPGAEPATLIIAEGNPPTRLILANPLAISVHTALQIDSAPISKTSVSDDLASQGSLAGSESANTSQLLLSPRSLSVFRIDSPNPRMSQATTTVTTEGRHDLDHQFLTAMKAIDHAISSDHKSIGRDFEGFESSLDVLELGGWSLGPLSQWTLDRQLIRTGRQSLKIAHNPRDSHGILNTSPMKFDAIRQAECSFWIKSDLPDVPIAVSLISGEHDPPEISLGLVRVHPHWKRLSFRLLDFQEIPINSGHLRFELMQPGTIWIDDYDVRLSEFTNEDLRQLERLRASLVLAHDHQRWTDLQELLDSYTIQSLLRRPMPPGP